MSTSHKKPFNSPFIWTTFQTTSNESKTSVYSTRIIDLYRDKYATLTNFSTEDIHTVLAQRKRKAFELLQKEKAEKEAQEKKEAEDKAKEKEKAEEKDKENEDEKDKEEKKDEADKDKDKDKDKDDKEEKKEVIPPKKDRVLNDTEKKLINALELLKTEYYGNEHDLYARLCTKYDIKTKDEYIDNKNTVTEKMLEDEANIKCSECAEMKPFIAYDDHELTNGYFAACKECEPDRDSVVTMKWSAIFKSNDVQLKHSDYMAQNARDSHRYVCGDMNNPIKQGMHCFRWYVKGHRSWCLIGISHPKKHRDGSYSEQGVYGIASTGTYYKNGATMYDIPANSMYNKGELMIDMRLDLQKYELWYTVLDDPDKKVMKMTGIDKNNKDGWVPHSNVYYQTVQLQIKKIQKKIRKS
eukprot:114744_1